VIDELSTSSNIVIIYQLSRLALKIVVMALGLRQEAKVKRVWAILLFFTQIGFIVFTYLSFQEITQKLLGKLLNLTIVSRIL
jgi:hypothetical protein